MFLKHHLPVIIWGIITLYLLEIPSNHIPDFPFLEQFHLDKIVHFSIFFIFTILLIRSFSILNKYLFIKNNAVIAALILSIIYGSLLEYLQGFSFIGRTRDILDLTANIIGSISGIPFLKFLKKYLKMFENV